MVGRKICAALCGLVLSVYGGAGAGTGTVRLVGGFPTACAERDLPGDLERAELIWKVRLGTHQYSIPTVCGQRIFVGTNDIGLRHHGLASTGGGAVMCLQKQSGQVLWRLVIPRFRKELHRPHFFDQWRCGVCSRPVVDGQRLYVVSNRGEILCLDVEGMANGNDGPFVGEAAYMGLKEGDGGQLRPGDGDIVWRYDMLQELGVYPHDVCGSTVFVCGQLLLVCTSNGVDSKHVKATNPDAPSLIVLDKRTGRLVAKDGERIGERIFHGQWSSPVATIVAGQVIILFGAGDGVLYAFSPPQLREDGEVQLLRKLWSYDCNPQEYRYQDGKKLRYCGWRNRYPGGPSEVIATPVVDKGRVYVAIGQSPIDGPGRGMLSCVDVRSGELIWRSKLVDRTLSTVAIAEGLVFVVDYSGRLHCFDADNGQRYWVHELGSPVWCASPFVADGKVYVGTEMRELWVFEVSRHKRVIWRGDVDSEPITLTAAEKVLYVPTQRFLYAYRQPEG